VALRVAVVGAAAPVSNTTWRLENQTNDSDEVVDFNGLKVAVDQI